jgi:hypothetical protein
MAEIVFDMAPGLSRILFSTGTETGAAGKALAIERLAAAGADVIADDIFYLSEPFFQDGIVAVAATGARDAGVAYLASAGNRERQSYEQSFRADGDVLPGDLHDFDPGAGVDTRQALFAVPPGEMVRVALQWDEPVGNVPTDLDLTLVDDVTGMTLAVSDSHNPSTGFPGEIATFTNTDPVSAVTPAVEIRRFSGSRAPLLKYIFLDTVPGVQSPAEFGTSSDAVNPDAAGARGTLAVAAMFHREPGLDEPEPFSSRGGLRRLFSPDGIRFGSPDVRQRPSLAAADGVVTTVPGFGEFFGTSAAVPHAAGVAALLRSANPAATVREIYTQLTAPANSIDCLAFGLPDPECGFGFILANRALTALDRDGPLVRPIRRPRRPDGKAGWYRRAVRVTWRVRDPDSPLSLRRGCRPSRVARNGVTNLRCRAGSGGGRTVVRLRIRRDDADPGAPRFLGIRAGAVDAGEVPDRSDLGCRARDAHSGLASCRVSGYGAAPGRHTLRAVAVDRAGNRSVGSLTYLVRR